MSRMTCSSKLCTLALVLAFGSCNDPVTPEFEYREGLVFIEGVASAMEGASFVSISASAIEYNVKVVNDVHGAEVSFVRPHNGDRMLQEEQPGGYVPPSDFMVSPGESWLVDIIPEDGTHYRSEEYVFGRFTRASSSPASVFIERTGIKEEAIEHYEQLNYEGCEVCPPGSSCPVDCSPVTITPCSETRYRTRLVPRGCKEI